MSVQMQRHVTYLCLNTASWVFCFVSYKLFVCCSSLGWNKLCPTFHLLVFVVWVFVFSLLSNAIFLSQAMDLYYHNESDPDSYCCPGDNSKSPPTKPVVLYFVFFLLSLLFSPHPSFTLWLRCTDSPSCVIFLHHLPLSLAAHFSLLSAVKFIFTINPKWSSPIHSLSVFLLFVVSLVSKPDGCGGKNDSACRHTLCHVTLPHHLAL